MEIILNDLTKHYDTIIELGIRYIPKLALAILTLFIGLIIVGFLVRFIVKTLENKDVDKSIIPFIRGIINVALKVILLITVAGMVGIKTTSFVAVLGAAGLAIGLALQGSLANFSGSLILLFFKPYEVGDVVDIQGETGVVDEIQIFNTKMTTFDNKVIYIPNGKIANDNIKNLSKNSKRRVDFTFGIGYGDSIDEAKKIFKKVASSEEKVLKNEDVFVKVTHLNDSSVDFAVRVWCETSDYWDVYHSIIENTKKELDNAGISIPFPQRDIHLYQESK